MNFISSLITGLILFKNSVAIPIDNGVLGDPEIECGPTSVGLYCKYIAY